MNCLSCNKPITVGNKNKKFCNEVCKLAYHNKKKNDENDEIRKIRQVLLTNRRILQSVLGKDTEVVISRDNLLKRGFDFDYHTHHIISRIKSNEFIFCYNYGYHCLENGKFKVVKSFK